MTMNNKKRKRHTKNDPSNKDKEIPSPPSTTNRTNSNQPSKSSNFLQKMRARLSGGHFKMINEKLYTCTGKEALHYFREDSSLFNLYHTGYKTQMSNWPEQPVNVIIKWLKKQSPSFVVADFGCGEALISKSVKNTVFSLDLVSNDPDVIACDMANTTLDSSAADVAVFCLSLMGTNYQTYLEEAYRVLKPGGWLLIAEVKSRFDPNNGGADAEKFSKANSELGFNSVKRELQIFYNIVEHVAVGNGWRQQGIDDVENCNYESVHEYLKRPEFVELKRRLGALGDNNHDQGLVPIFLLHTHRASYFQFRSPMELPTFNLNL